MVTKPGLLAFTCLKNSTENCNSILFEFHYNSCEFLALFLKKVSKNLKDGNFKEFEDQIDSDTFGGIKNEKVYLRNALDSEFVFQDEDTLFFFITGVAELLPSIILPNTSETQNFLKDSFEGNSLFFNTHKTFINYWRCIKILRNND